MITFRKLSADGAGKLILAYLREHRTEPDQDVRFDANPDRESGERLNNYYTARDERGSWGPDMGERIATALGIDPIKLPTDEALGRLFEAKRADTGDHWANTGRKREISAIDFTSAPHKSVSVAILLARSSEEQALLWQAMHRANDTAMRFIAKEIGLARRGSGDDAYIEQGEVAWVTFRHHSARPVLDIQDGRDGATAKVEVPVPGDPQAHLHNPMFNAVATESGHLGSLDSARVTSTTAHLFGAVFQAAFAAELRSLGIKVSPDNKGRSIAIDAVPKGVCDHFSKRSQQAQRKAKAFAKKQGRNWSDLTADQKFTLLHQANLAYRSAKYTGNNDREIWEAQAEEIGWGRETVLTNHVTETISDAERFSRAYEIASAMIAEDFKTAAVLDRDVLRTHAAHGFIAAGLKEVEEIERLADHIEHTGLQVEGKHTALRVRSVNGRVRIATQEQIDLEREMGRLAGEASRMRDGALTEGQIAAAVARSGLDFEREPDHGAAQLAAMRGFGQAGRLSLLVGVAGSGKTTMLRPLVDAWHEDGRKVIGTAMAWRQTNALKDAGIKKGFALTPLLSRMERGDLKLGPDGVLVIDEVSQVAPKQLLRLLRLRERQGFSLRLLGDREQAQAIGAGDSIEILERVLPKDQQMALTSTVRQDSRRKREIAGLFRSPGRDLTMTEDEQREEDKARARQAIDMKRRDGTLTLVGGDYDQVVSRIAEFYLRRRDMLVVSGSKRGITMSAPTNEDALALGLAVRERLRQRGEIGTHETIRPAMSQRGNETDLYDLPIAAGDRLRLYSRTWGSYDTKWGVRRCELGVNGDFATVVSWDENGLKLANDKGRQGFVSWDSLTDSKTGRLRLGLGYAMTIDAAQGVNSGEHINAMPRGTASVTGFTTYVAESRHVSQCWTFVAEAALREAEQWSRPLGDKTAITVNDLYDRMAADMGRHPYKALAIDLVRQRLAYEEDRRDWIRAEYENDRAALAGQTPGKGARQKRERKGFDAVKPGQWDDLGRKLRKAGFATQNAMDRANQGRRSGGIQERRSLPQPALDFPPGVQRHGDTGRGR